MNRRAPFIAGGVLALLVVLAVVVLVLPKMGQVGEVQDELETAQDQETALEAQRQALREAQEQAPETERQIAELEDQVPATADLPALFRLLQGAADRSAVDFFSFSPGSPIVDATGSFSVLPSSITVNGSYFAIDEFLFLLETLPRAAKVVSIAVTPGAEALGTTTTGTSLQIVMTVEFYTTDVSAGPASQPGPTEGAGAAPTGTTGPAATATDAGDAT
jgi:Tfp pilus assembly protein PilO